MSFPYMRGFVKDSIVVGGSMFIIIFLLNLDLDLFSLICGICQGFSRRQRLNEAVITFLSHSKSRQLGQ